MQKLGLMVSCKSWSKNIVWFVLTQIPIIRPLVTAP